MKTTRMIASSQFHGSPKCSSQQNWGVGAHRSTSQSTMSTEPRMMTASATYSPIVISRSADRLQNDGGRILQPVRLVSALGDEVDAVFTARSFDARVDLADRQCAACADIALASAGRFRASGPAPARRSAATGRISSSRTRYRSKQSPVVPTGTSKSKRS